MKLSICMIVKNEEFNLQRCLDSFLPIIQMKDDDTLEAQTELIIVDTGSTDKTVNIAKKFTDKVFIQEFIPWDFSAARNYGIEKATGEWILIVDADEQLTQESVYHLEDAILNPKFNQINTVFMRVHSFYTIGTKEYAPVSQPRMFRNTHEPLYTRAVHNKAKTDMPYMFMGNVIFNHYGYLFEKVDLFIQKKERSLPMLVADNQADPKDLHALTHLIKTYYACGDYKNVIKYGEVWIKLLRKVDYHEGWMAYLEVFANLLGAYTLLNNPRGAERIFRESQKYSKRLVSLYLILGQFHLNKGRIKRARQLMEDAYLMSKVEGSAYEQLLSSNAEVVMPEILNCLALICFEEGDYDRAAKYMNEGIILNQGRLPLRWDLWNFGKCRGRLVGDTIKKKVR